MPFMYAHDFIEVLKQKHASNSYKEMVKFKDLSSSFFKRSN